MSRFLWLVAAGTKATGTATNNISTVKTTRPPKRSAGIAIGMRASALTQSFRMRWSASEQRYLLSKTRISRQLVSVEQLRVFLTQSHDEFAE
jgi:hypothetical protein